MLHFLLIVRRKNKNFGCVVIQWQILWGFLFFLTCVLQTLLKEVLELWQQMHIEETRNFAKTNYNEKTRKIKKNKSFFFFLKQNRDEPRFSSVYDKEMTIYFSSFFGFISLFFGFISLIFFHAFFTRCPKVVISPPPLPSNTTNSNHLINQSKQQLSSSNASSDSSYFFLR